MAGTLRLKIKKYFGSTAVQQMEFSLEEARDYLAYFFTPDGGSNVKISVLGQAVNSYAELVGVVKREDLKEKAVVEVGLFLSNEGRESDSIWVKRNK